MRVGSLDAHFLADTAHVQAAVCFERALAREIQHLAAAAPCDEVGDGRRWRRKLQSEGGEALLGAARAAVARGRRRRVGIQGHWEHITVAARGAAQTVNLSTKINGFGRIGQPIQSHAAQSYVTA